jgi:hypothetical protein
MQSPIYWHPKLYELTMKSLYGRYYKGRYTNLEKVIPANCNLLELCMGDLHFYEYHLKSKNVNYKCGDVNPVFVNGAKAKGVDCQLIDFIKDPIPRADYILIQASLYHAIPDQVKVIEKLFAAANKQLIISESVKNVSNSDNVIIASLAGFISKAKSGQSKIKFTPETLKAALSGLEKNVVQWIEPEDSLETIIVLQKPS